MTNIPAIIAAVANLIIALGFLIPILRNTRATHTIVNQQRTDMLNYQAALTAALMAAGVEVPPDQSKGGGRGDQV